MQRDSTIEVLEEQLQLWTAKVSGNILMRVVVFSVCFFLTRFEFIAGCYAIIRFNDSIDPLLFCRQAEQAQHIYIENEKKLEEMLDGIEKLFG